MNIVRNYIYKVSVLLGCAVFTVLAPSALAEDTCDLCDATKRGQYDIINAKLSEVSVTVSVNGSDDDGYTALIWAAKKGYLNIVKLLMTNTHERASVELKDNTKGRSALLWASGRGQASIVEYLLRDSPVRADPNARDSKGKVGLDIALKQNGSSVIDGSVLVFKALLDNGANVSELDAVSREVFAFAAQKNNNDLLKALIESEGNLELSYKGAPTFLLYAVKQDNKELAAKLIEGSANVNGANSGGRTPLIVASNLGHEDMVRVLLSVSAISVGHQDNSGKSALDYAMAGNNAGVVTELLYGGVVFSFATNTSEYIRVRRPKISSELVKALLLSSTVDVSYEGENSILLWAVKQGKVGLVRALLADGASKEKEDNDGNRASYVAAGLEKEKIEKVLEDPLPSDYEHTLRWSLKDGRVKGDYALRDELDSGGSVDIAFGNENSILLWAVKNNKVDLVGALVEDGADEATAKNSAGNTALYIAIGEGYEGIVKLLQNDFPEVMNTIRWALNDGNDGLRDALVSAKNVDIAYDKEKSILLWAVKNDKVGLVSVLVADGANKGTKDKDGNKASYVAAGLEKEKIEEVLKDPLPSDYENTLRWSLKDGKAKGDYALRNALDIGRNVDIAYGNENSILLWAVKNNKVALVGALVDDGANESTAKDSAGNTALYIAIGKGYEGIVNLLQNDLSKVINTMRWALNEDNDDLRDELVKAKNVDIVYDNRNSILLWAIYSFDTALVKALIDDGANLEVRDSSGQSALYNVTSNSIHPSDAGTKLRRYSIFIMLLDAGADKNSRRTGETTTMLYAALQKGINYARELLSTRGGTAPVGTESKSGGFTLLERLVRECFFQNSNMEKSSHLKKVELLIEFGADVTAGNKEGRSTLMSAVSAIEQSQNDHCVTIADVLLTANSTSAFCNVGGSGRTALDYARRAIGRNSGRYDDMFNNMVATIESHCPAPPSGN